MPPPDDAPAPGTPGPDGDDPLDIPSGYRVAEWQVGELLGAGAWGSVHAARGPAGTPDAAVKFLRPALLGPGRRRTMTEVARSEARFSRRADHPNLIRTFAVVTVDDPATPAVHGAVALVMERADRSVQDVLAAARPAAPVAGAERILADVCAGLTHMHRAGWVHGDLKPANVLLMPDGTAKLADFGLTAELDGTHAYAPPIGSPDHVPPEWWSERSGPHGVALRPSADIWAFGVLAHQVLTGGLHPFLGATARARSLAAQSYARGAAPLRLDDGLAPHWRELVAACLAVDRVERARVDPVALLARARVHARSAAATGSTADAGRTATGRAASGTPAATGDRAAADGPGTGGVPSRTARPTIRPATHPAIHPTTRPTGRTDRPGRTRRFRFAFAAAVAVGALAGALSLAADGAAPGAARVSAGVRSQEQAPGRALRGAIPAGADVPAELRGPIEDAARRCPEPEITPVLLAAMLKAESGFDPRAARPETNEYGIAMWTPSVFNAWAQDGDHDGRKDHLSPPDAIAALGNYVCWLDQRFKHRGLTDDLPALVAAGYRTSDKTVAEAGGVPERVRPHVAKVLGYLAEYGG